MIESTVAPGTTMEICVPLLERTSGLRIGYSPERINPGDSCHTFVNTSKIVSGSDDQTTMLISNIYSSVITGQITRASTIEHAEASKMIENAQRDMNIAFANEMSLAFSSMGLSFSEVLRLARSKWNFVNVRPGLVGGHCIGIDSYYLIEACKKASFPPNVLKAARTRNESMVAYVAGTILAFTKRKNASAPATVAFFGATFKENCNDLRNSKTLELAQSISAQGLAAYVHDPLVSEEALCDYLCRSICFVDNMKRVVNSDVAVLAVGHSCWAASITDLLINAVKKGGAVIDIPGLADEDRIIGAGLNYWSLV